MVMMVVMVVVIPPAGRNHIDAWSVAIIAVVMVVMMMVVVVVPLRHLHIAFRRFGRRLFIKRLQDFCGVRNRLEQLGIGVGLQRVRRVRCRRG